MFNVDKFVESCGFVCDLTTGLCHKDSHITQVHSLTLVSHILFNIFVMCSD